MLEDPQGRVWVCANFGRRNGQHFCENVFSGFFLLWNVCCGKFFPKNLFFFLKSSFLFFEMKKMFSFFVSISQSPE